MSRNTIKYLLVLALITSGMAVVAQPADNSPLSRIGIGEPVGVDFAASSAQGGLGSAFWHLHQANLQNPASLGFLEATAFETGFFAKRSAISRNEFSANIWSGNLEYLSLSFPILNPINELLERREREFAWGVNVSLLPFSRVGYSISSEDVFDSIGVVSRSFQGTGGLYRFNVGNGWRYQDLAFGLNLGYVFGRTSYSAETSFDEIAGDYQHIARSDISYRSFVWDAGIQYNIQLTPTPENNRRYITLGARFNSSRNFDTERDYLNYVRNIAFNDADTAVYETDQKGSGMFPAEFGAGVIFKVANSWSFGLDYSRQGWSEYFNEARPDTLRNTWRFAAGGTYTPDASSITSYISRIEYRAGFFYQQDPRVLEGEQARRYGVTVGAGMPFVFLRSFSYLNIGLELGKAGTENALEENYFRARIGLVLNDNQWFLKRRYQ